MSRKRIEDRITKFGSHDDLEAPRVIAILDLRSQGRAVRKLVGVGSNSTRNRFYTEEAVNTAVSASLTE